MKVDRTLAVQVAAAVGAMLVGRDAITLDEVEQALPATLRAGKPSHKSMTKALAAAGWVGTRQPGGAVVYRAPDALQRVAEADGSPSIGHNGVHERLLSYFERVERLFEERKGINDDIADVFGEAKNEGFDVHAMRTVLRQRGMVPEKRMEQFALVDLYATAIGLGASQAPADADAATDQPLSS